MPNCTQWTFNTCPVHLFICFESLYFLEYLCDVTVKIVDGVWWPYEVGSGRKPAESFSVWFSFSFLFY